MISIIVAIAANGVIGCKNRLIWHISEDLKRFKRLTSGHAVIMGRRTFESIGRPLSGRRNVVVSRNALLGIEGAEVVGSLEQALELCRADQNEVFVIGGGDIYRQSMDLADRLYVTHVEQSPEGDTSFPEIDPAQWVITEREEHSEQGYAFVNYVRAKRKLIFATANLHKLQEVQQLMPPDVELSIPAEYGIMEDIPENEPTLEGNASCKAWYIYNRTGCDCFADDTGLEVEALGGAPGVYSARYAGEGRDSRDNMVLLLSNMKGKSNRKARFRTVISLIVNGVEHQFEGSVSGSIRDEGSGCDGFGYDPVFEPEGYSVTFAEMSLEQKNQISHRARATAQLIEWLRGNRPSSIRE